MRCRRWCGWGPTPTRGRASTAGPPSWPPPATARWSARTLRTKRGKTALEIAEASGNAEVAALLEALLSPAEKARWDRRKLDEQFFDAAAKGDAAAIERLAAEGASPDAKDGSGFPAVYVAAAYGHAGAVSALVRLGADLDARFGSDGKTALMSAALDGNVECARALLAGGADRTLRATGWPHEGQTALEIAEGACSWKAVALLRG